MPTPPPPEEPGRLWPQPPPSPGQGWGPPAGPTQQQPWGAYPQNSGKATASLVLGICGIVVCPIVLSIIGLVLGYQARNEIRASGGRVTGESNAKAGIVLGWVGLAIWVVLIAAYIIFIVVLVSTDPTTLESTEDF